MAMTYLLWDTDKEQLYKVCYKYIISHLHLFIKYGKIYLTYSIHIDKNKIELKVLISNSITLKTDLYEIICNKNLARLLDIPTELENLIYKNVSNIIQ